MMRSTAATASADSRNVTWIIVCEISIFSSYEFALMNVFSRWIDEMPMIAVASFTLSTLALTCDSHSGWSGWPSSRIRDTNVS